MTPFINGTTGRPNNTNLVHHRKYGRSEIRLTFMRAKIVTFKYFYNRVSQSQVDTRSCTFTFVDREGISYRSLSENHVSPTVLIEPRSNGFGYN